MAVQPVGPGISTVNNGQPTLPPGSIVDDGSGAKVTPIAPGKTGAADTALYSRVEDVPAVNTIKTNVELNADEQPAKDLADVTRAAQSAVDYSTGVFNKRIQDFSSGEGANNVGRANSTAALLGLAGAPGANDRESAATGQNKKTTDAIDQQRAARIAQIYGSLDTAQLEAGKEAEANSKTESDAYSNDTQKRATSVLTSLAGELKNVSFSQFKQADPQTYSKILQLAGGDESKLELLYNSSMSPDAKTKSTYHWENGQAFEINADGDAKRRPDLDTKTPAAQTGSSKVVNVGGTLFNFPVDENGHYVIDPNKSMSDYIFKGSTAGEFKASAKTAAAAGGTPLTKTQYSRLESAGVDQTTADKLTSAILKGIPLDQIREALRKDGTDPAILDHYDNVVGIASLLKSKPKATSGGPVVVPGVTQ